MDGSNLLAASCRVFARALAQSGWEEQLSRRINVSFESTLETKERFDVIRCSSYFDQYLRRKHWGRWDSLRSSNWRWSCYRVMTPFRRSVCQLQSILVNCRAHIVGLDHCDWYACIMNASCDALCPETAQLWLCPPCMVKFCLVTGLNHKSTNNALKQWCSSTRISTSSIKIKITWFLTEPLSTHANGWFPQLLI